MTPFASITENLCGPIKEALLWDVYSAIIGEDHDMGCTIEAYKRPMLEALIRTAHVIVERDDELLGLFKTAKGFESDRFVWISMMTDRADHEYRNQTCIADEYSAVEFEFQQHD